MRNESHMRITFVDAFAISDVVKVTKLDRDPSTGTALQEISFWLNLERALNRVLERRESLEVTLTLDILRYGKRFSATVSFESDTGLKEALETAKDYNSLMKDFPLNELMSATELPKITAAVQSVFAHLKRVRNSKYPLPRTLKLIEAISKDLTAQLLKVPFTIIFLFNKKNKFFHIFQNFSIITFFAGGLKFLSDALVICSCQLRINKIKKIRNRK